MSPPQNDSRGKNKMPHPPLPALLSRIPQSPARLCARQPEAGAALGADFGGRSLTPDERCGMR